jgi:hypothetical protein
MTNAEKIARLNRLSVALAAIVREQLTDLVVTTAEVTKGRRPGLVHVEADGVVGIYKIDDGERAVRRQYLEYLEVEGRRVVSATEDAELEAKILSLEVA